MEKKYINPDTLLQPRGYTHVVTVEGAGKLIFVSGQVAADKDGKLVGAGDLGAQVKEAGKNLIRALESAGATQADIVKMNTYVVNYKQADLRTIGEARRELFGTDNQPASTLVGVTSLAVDGLMVEMEAIAVVK